MSAIKIIQALGRKIAAKKAKTPEGITQIQPQIYAETRASNIIERLVNSGLSMDRFDDFIRSEADLVRILNQIEALNKRNFEQSIRSGIKNTETGKVFDLEGKEIDPRSKIMGGKQSETEAEIAERLGKENKQAAQRMKNKKLVQDAIDNVSPGFVKGDRKYNAEIVAEEIANQRGLDYYDMDTKQRLDIYDEAFQALTKMTEDFAQGGRAGFDDGGLGFKTNNALNQKSLDLFGVLFNFLDDKQKKIVTKRVGNADGGRIGLKDGMSRRKFMQIMGGLAALPIVGKFFKAGKVAAPAVEAAKETVTQAPSYFFDLVNKIKMFGKEGIPIGPRKRTINYKNYELTEDISTGDITIVKQKGDPDFAYEEEVMLLRRGQADETTKGRTPPDEYEELTVRPDMEGKMKDVEDGIEPEGIQEIIQEASGEAPSIKKAGGGIARMLGE